MIPDYGFYLITKDNCSYCTKAVELMKENNIFFEYCNKNDIDDIEMLKEKYKIKTYPIIFNDGHYIGGYDELYKYCNNLII